MLLEGETSFWDTPRFFSSLIMSSGSLGLDAVKMPSEDSGAESTEVAHGQVAQFLSNTFKGILDDPEEISKSKRKGLQRRSEASDTICN